jgi:exodeoxyribonuclease-3
MKIVTWNVNSINARLPRVTEWLSEFSPDVALLQELKCMDEKFPNTEIEDLGYNVITHGQKSYNGVAILSKHPIEDVMIVMNKQDT